MSLTIEDITSTIAEVSLAGKFVSVLNGAAIPVDLFIRHPTLEESQAASFYRSSSLTKARDMGLPSMEEMEKLLVQRGLWTSAHEASVKDFSAQLEAQRVLLSKTVRVPANRERIKGNITALQNKLWDVRKIKESKFEHTQERRADEDRLLYLTWVCTYRPDMCTRYWLSFDDFRNERDVSFRSNVSIRYALFSVGFQQGIIREVARSSSWRLRFLAAQKNFGKLFPREVYDYSTDMISLVYWSNFYASLQEMMPEDRPEDSIVEDDAALDAYMEDYFKEQARKHAEARSNGTKYGKSSAWSHEETLVTPANPLRKDVLYSETLAERLRRKGDVATTDKELSKT